MRERRRLRGKAKQGMENKKKREKESNTVILCWRLNKQAGHVEQKIPVYLKVFLRGATTARGQFSCLEECWWKIITNCFSSPPEAFGMSKRLLHCKSAFFLLALSHDTKQVF